MNIQKKFHFQMPALLLVMLVLISLACGRSATPAKIGQAGDEAKPEHPPALATEVPAQAPAEAAPTDPPALAQQVFNVGDVVSIGDSVLVVLGWEDVAGSDFAKPDEGNKFITTEIVLVNQSGSPASISSLLQMSLKDETGQKYRPDLKASVAAQAANVDGELSPGERKRGKVGFQVPVNVRGLQFVFDADVFGAGKAMVNLGAAPVKVEPPAELAGETKQQSFKVGDVVEIGSLVLTVNGVTSPAGTDFAKPEAGHKFLVVDVTVENKGTEAAAVSTMLQMSVKDETGQVYKVDLMAQTASGGTSPDGELAPGEKIRGQVGFQTPQTAAGLVFVFDADVFGAGKVFVALP